MDSMLSNIYLVMAVIYLIVFFIRKENEKLTKDPILYLFVAFCIMAIFLLVIIPPFKGQWIQPAGFLVISLWNHLQIKIFNTDKFLNFSNVLLAVLCLIASGKISQLSPLLETRSYILSFIFFILVLITPAKIVIDRNKNEESKLKI